MKLYLVVFSIDGPDDGPYPAFPTDYEPSATLVCALNFKDAMSEAGSRCNVAVYELGDAVMGMSAGIIFETKVDIKEIQQRMIKHPKHKTRAQ